MGAFDRYTFAHLFWGVAACYAIPGNRAFSFVCANLMHVATEWHELDVYPTRYGSSVQETDENHMGDQIAFALGWALAEVAAAFRIVTAKRQFLRASVIFWGAFIFELAIEWHSRWHAWKPQ
jgi:hypothetical protein